MTLLDPHLDVDQVSAAVDGERDAATAAHLLVCLACREQVETWRSALAPLRAPAEAPCADTLIARAMADWDGPDPRLRPGPPAVDVRRRRRPTATVARRWKAVTAAAAVVVVAAAGVGGLRHLRTPPSPAALTSPAGDLGAVAGPAQLSADLRRVLPSAAPVATRPPCLRDAQRLASADATDDRAAYESAVRLAGVAGRVFVFPDADGYVAFVLHSPTCLLLATVRF